MLTTVIALVALSNQVQSQEPIPNDIAPAFTLTDTNGKTVSLSDFKGKYVVLEWWNQECPVVNRHYEAGSMQATQKVISEAGGVWLQICSSAEGKQGYTDGPKANAWNQRKDAVVTATLLDPKGEVGRTYRAKNTPQMFIITPEQKIAYQGAIDSNMTGNQPAGEVVNYVLQAWKELQEGKPVSNPVTKPYGCRVHY